MRELTWIVGRDVNRTVGGGNASMELLRRSSVAREWIDAAGHGVLVAVSRLTPGTNILAYCVMLGWRLHGMRGGVAALLAASVPASALVFVLTAALVRIDRYRAVQMLLAVGILVAAVLVIASAWQLIRPYLPRAYRVPLVVITVVAAALLLTGATPVRVLLASAAVGAAIARR